MTANQAMFPIHAMCHAFGVSRSGYYAWAGRRPSAWANADAVLAERITAIRKASKETYGAPRIHAELADEGVQVARKRVERLMKAAGIAGVGIFAPPSATTGVSRPAIWSIATSTPMPRTLWVADITYVPTWGDFLYLAVVLDAFSRRIVGWAMGHDLKSQLVLDAINMALVQRRPVSVIHHSDQGSQLPFNRSSQRLDEGGCDGRQTTEIISLRTSSNAVTRTAFCGGSN